jgi:8-oxo-dGTP diphosphatase
MISSVSRPKPLASVISHFVSVAILRQQGRFLLELRRDLPGKHYGNYWGICGGHIETGETPEAALRRELLEEIGHHFTDLEPINHYSDMSIMSGVKCFAYYSDLDVELSSLVQSDETQELALFTPAEIVSGQKFSEKRQTMLPIVPIYHRILLDFLRLETPALKRAQAV